MPLGRRCILLLLLLTVTLVASACEDINRDSRARLASDGKGPVVIGLVWGDGVQGQFVEGAILARDELNGRNGTTAGILGRPVAFVEIDASGAESDPRRAALSMARSIASHPDLVAVVGHGSAATAVPASITYEEQGILYINPAITQGTLNKYGFDFVFSTIPDNESIARRVATFAFGLGYRRIGLLNGRDDASTEIATAFAKHAATLGMTIVTRTSFFERRENFRDILADLGAKQFDAIFLAANFDAVVRVVRQSMEMNLEAPFMIGGLYDVLALRKAVGQETPRIAVPNLFNPFDERSTVRRFRQSFLDRFGTEPDGWAAQGYDAIHMLATAMRRADTTVPLSVATILRYALAWRGITGRHSFERNGSIYTKVIGFTTLEQGKIQFFSPEGGVTDLVEPESESESDDDDDDDDAAAAATE